MDTQKAQIVDRLKQANNILVTVSASPSIDQLAAAIGMTLLLNKLGKHATAVFSGQVPSILEFLEPAKTIETNTDSLRDFIISLDKSKADKLRYKVEDNHVRIFITPYRTSISDKDLVFSQGDFNVEAVLAIGISKQQDLDQAIAIHGRILHDATVMGISDGPITGLGTMNLIDTKASSLSEMMVSIGTALKPDVLDMQMATAFLTGIVAQTNRFSNEKTTSTTMEVSSRLLAAGANQQLVATKLQPPKPPAPVPTPPLPVASPPSATPVASPVKPIPAATADAAISLPEPVPDHVASDGSLQIDHGPVVDLDNYEFSEEDSKTHLEQINIDDQGHLKAVKAGEQSQPPAATTHEKVLSPLDNAPKAVDNAAGTATTNQAQAPVMGGTLTASGTDDETEKTVNPMAEPVASAPVQPLLSHTSADMTPPLSTEAPAGNQPENLDQTVVQASNTLEDLERSVQSPHISSTATTPPVGSTADAPSSIAGAPPVPITNVADARDAVAAAMDVGKDEPLPPIEALGAQYMDLPSAGEPSTSQTTEEPQNSSGLSNPAASDPSPQSSTAVPASPKVSDPSAPPSVPPPMMPPSFASTTTS